MQSISLAIAIATAAAVVGDDGGAPDLSSELIAEGLDRPTVVTAAPGDATRLYIGEQAGLIKVYDRLRGTVNETPFLDLTDRVLTTHRDVGLMCVAFDPDYPRNGYVYVSYFGADGSRVSRFDATAPDEGNADSEHVVFLLYQPTASHDIGWIGFGPLDGLMYIGAGDGSTSPVLAGDAQDIGVLYGKMLRIDAHGTDGPTGTYGIPPSNPFVGVDGADEVFLYGLRSPYRSHIDPVTNDLWIADVGGWGGEEIDVIQAGTGGGQNLGWNCYQADDEIEIDDACELEEFVFPVHAYDHGGGRCAIIGGEVYRGCAIPSLQGAYLFADFCSGEIWSLRTDPDSGGVTELLDLTAELQPPPYVTTFGADGSDELYYCTRGTGLNEATTEGKVFRITAGDGPTFDGTPPTPPAELKAKAKSPTRIDLKWSAATDPESGIVTYRVIRDGELVAIVAAPDTTYADTGLVEETTYAYAVVATNCAGLQGPAAEAHATTPADVLSPTIESALGFSNPSNIRLRFSETLDEASAETMANYQIDLGVSISSATLAPDGVTVTLATSQLTPATTYTLTVNGVIDASNAGNPIARNTQVSITVEHGDIDQDGSVGVADLVALILAWGDCPPAPAPCPADLNGDGTVNVPDLVLMITNWD